MRRNFAVHIVKCNERRRKMYVEPHRAYTETRTPGNHAIGSLENEARYCFLLSRLRVRKIKTDDN